MNDLLTNLDRETLAGMLEDFAKNWLAHDGLWFQAVEQRDGLEAAIQLDEQAWAKFSEIEAKRIMARHAIPSGSGLEGLRRALGFRLYAVLNTQKVANVTPNSFDYFMVECRVQYARRQKSLAPFPCKSVGLIEYDVFARTIDNRITTTCLCCPPDPAAGTEFWCGWRFSI
ncbi:MAG: hypothetical protein HY851_11765 [candidate division Zixibacteria bacterium]|nr:hypothetical protein [candidate division Zixibacteria bacterium]